MGGSGIAFLSAGSSRKCSDVGMLTIGGRSSEGGWVLDVAKSDSAWPRM